MASLLLGAASRHFECAPAGAFCSCFLFRREDCGTHVWYPTYSRFLPTRRTRGQSLLMNLPGANNSNLRPYGLTLNINEHR
jgi:hypothetical protein